MKQFRETLWFKRGDLERDIAVDATRGELPVEDRYLDDESLTGEDSAQYSLRTGGTDYIQITFIEKEPTPEDLKSLVGEMRGVRGKLALIGGGIAASCVALALLVI